jgi:phosphotransferase system enzyme I (PtsI)
MGDVASTTGSADASGGELIIPGTAATSGVAIGSAYRYDASVPDPEREQIAADEVEAELKLLADAVQRAEQEIDTTRMLAHESLEARDQDIFEAQAMMLRDEELLGAVRERIREQKESAGTALKRVLQRHRTRLEENDDPYLRERARDLVDLEKHLLRALQRGWVRWCIEDYSIVVAQSLTATEVLRLSRHGMRGCVIEDGGTTSHVSIIADTLGIPTVVGSSDDVRTVSTGDPVILDGDEGRLVVNPSPSTVDRYEQRSTEQEGPGLSSKGKSDRPAVTTDGQVIALRANIDLEDELGRLASSGAEGIGLLRTEMVFLADPEGVPSEERQVQVYRKAAAAAGDQGATIRLLDLGGDKHFPSGPEELNPSLGWRGIRVLLDRPDDLLRPQLRALLRANAEGRLRVLLPMVAHLEEVRHVRTMLAEEQNRLSREGLAHSVDLPLGVMVEVPAVAQQAEAFAEHVDFFSVGTNDLTQYVLAVDRSNDRVSDRYDALHPAVLALVQRAVEAGHGMGCSVEVCGEAAADVQAAPVLVGLGVDALSVSPQSLPIVRRLIRTISAKEARGLAEDGLAATDAETVRQRAQEWVDTHAFSPADSG